MKSPYLLHDFHPSVGLAVDTSIGVAAAIGAENRREDDYGLFGLLENPERRYQAVDKLGLSRHAVQLSRRVTDKLAGLADTYDFSPDVETYFHHLFSAFDFKMFDVTRFQHAEHRNPAHLANLWLSAATSQPDVRRVLPLREPFGHAGISPVFDLDAPSGRNTAFKMALTVVEEVLGDPVVNRLAFGGIEPEAYQWIRPPKAMKSDAPSGSDQGFDWPDFSAYVTASPARSSEPPADAFEGPAAALSYEASPAPSQETTAEPSYGASFAPPGEPPSASASGPSPGGSGPEQRFLAADIKDLQGGGLTPRNLLLVTCSLPLGSSDRHDAQTAIETDTSVPRVTFVLSTTGFTCLTAGSVTIDLPPGKDSQAVAFNLVAEAGSDHSITVAVFQDAVFKGELLIRDIEQILAKAKPVAAFGAVSLIAEPANAGTGMRTVLRDPELMADLTIILDSLDSEIWVSSPRGALNKGGDNIGKLKADARNVLRSVRDDIAKLYRSKMTLNDVQRELDNLGSEIARILPDELKTYLADPRVKLVYFKIGVDADLPIELCLLSRDGEDDIRLSDKCAIVRWYRESKAASNRGVFQVGSLAFIAGRLVHGFDGEEQAVMGNHTIPKPLRAETLNEVRTKIFAQALHDVIHFKGHIENGDGKETAISLKSGEQLRLREIGVRGDERAVFKREPIVFFNGCDAVISSQLIGGKSSFPYRFCDLNATAFIGTLWEVDERPASLFTKRFYGELRDKKSAAEAVRNARLELMRIAEHDADLTDQQRVTHYLASRAYVYFGPCDMHVNFV